MLGPFIYSLKFRNSEKKVLNVYECMFKVTKQTENLLLMLVS